MVIKRKPRPSFSLAVLGAMANVKRGLFSTTPLRKQPHDVDENNLVEDHPGTINMISQTTIMFYALPPYLAAFSLPPPSVILFGFHGLLTEHISVLVVDTVFSPN